MITSEHIKQFIAAAIPCTHLQVDGDGQHFYVTVVSEQFNDKKLLERHRHIKDLLKNKLHSNEVHALSIVKALTPEEWEKQQGN